jgi:hypothetical protein
MTEGTFEVTVAGRGAVAVAVEGVEVEPKLQRDFGAGAPLSPKSFTRSDFAGLHAMLLAFGTRLTSAYVYLDDAERQWEKAVLRYRARPGDRWQTAEDGAFPLEFSIPLSVDDGPFEFQVETVARSGQRRQSESLVLER